jgi:hypothetical protein
MQLLDLDSAPEADPDGAGQRRVVAALFVVSEIAGSARAYFLGPEGPRKQVDWSAGLD